jgi:hypothetical protein
MAVVQMDERHSHVDQYAQSGNTIKSHTVEEYNCHMGYMDKIEKTTNTYSIRYCMCNWMKKLFLLICYIRLFWTVIFFFVYVVESESHIENCDLLAHADNRHMWRGKPADTSKITRLDSRGNKYWPIPSNWLWCQLCPAHRVTRKVM